MTLFDMVTIAILAISGLLALVRGFTNEMLSILAWLVAGLAALWLFPLAAPLLRDIISPEWLAAAASAVGIFIAVFIAVSVICHRWGERLHKLHPHVGVLDRTLGLIFGVARGLLIVAVAFLVIDWASEQQADQQPWIQNARLFPLVQATADTVFRLAPEGTLSGQSSQNNQYPAGPYSGEAPPLPTAGRGGNQANPASANTASRNAQPPSQATESRTASNAVPRASTTDKVAGKGYKEAEREGLDRLFESQDPR